MPMRSQNNVTPFRPRRPKRGNPGDGLRTPRGQVLLLHALTLTTFGLFLATTLQLAPPVVDWLALALGVASLAIAASRRVDGMPWARTHHEMGVRTLVIGAAVWTLARLAGLIPGVGAFVGYALIAVVGWVAIRALVGFIRGMLRQPFANPKTLLI